MKKTLLTTLFIIAILIFISFAVSKIAVLIILTEMIFGFSISIIVHEFGHFISAKLCGFGVNIIYFGLLTFIRRNNKWSINIKLIYHPFFFGAIRGISIPTVNSDNEIDKLVKKWAVINFSGPVASLLFGIVTLLIENMRRDPSFSYLSLFLLIFSAMSIMTGMITLIFTDGLGGMQYLKDKDWGLLIILMLGMSNELPSRDDKYQIIIDRINKSANNIKEYGTKDKDMFRQLYIHYFILYYHLCGIIKYLPNSVISSLEYIASQRDKLLNSTVIRSITVELLHLIIIYWQVFENELQKSSELFTYLTRKIKHDSYSLRYVKLRSAYFINLSDDYNFLEKRENMSNFYVGEGFYEAQIRILDLSKKMHFNN